MKGWVGRGWGVGWGGSEDTAVLPVLQSTRVWTVRLVCLGRQGSDR